MICSYCENVLEGDNLSGEHIILNALGGLIESEIICCKTCNGGLGEKEDTKFAAIFAPITENINMKKSRKSKPAKYKATVIDRQGNLYTATMKGREIWEVFNEEGEFMREKTESFSVVCFHFDLDNTAFSDGMIKIAFNFAVHSGIKRENLELVYSVEEKRLRLDGNHVIPFVPLNYFDELLEAEGEIDLVHTLILFSQKNVLLAYIDLFGLFQYYVILSTRWNGDQVYVSYCQRVEKNIFDEEEMNKAIQITRMDDISILAGQYGIEPTFEIEKFRKQIMEIIRKRTYEIELGEYIENKFSAILNNSHSGIDYKRVGEMLFYFLTEVECDGDDEWGSIEHSKIDMNRFRIWNYTKDDAKLYVEAIIEKIGERVVNEKIRFINNQKFRKLSKLLSRK